MPKKILLAIAAFFALFALPLFPVQAQSSCEESGVFEQFALDEAEKACITLMGDEATCMILKCMISQQGADDKPWYNQSFGQFSKKVLNPTNETEIFGERYTYAQINWIINSLALTLNPVSASSLTDVLNLFQHMRELLQTANNGAPPTLQQYAQLGPTGLFAGGVAAIYSSPPASAIQETKYLAERIFDSGTGAQPAYAQGYGFTGLDSGGAVRALWTASRNMAYLIIVILLVASGFLIMFRVKINPQTVVSLQVMIPKLIITLLLVTFSFAIAGFVIDLIYVTIAAVVGMLSFGGLIDNVGFTIKELTSTGFIHYALPQAAMSIIITLGISAVMLFIGIGALPIGILGAILAIVVLGFWIINLFKIFWMLLKAYVMLILHICIGPLQIMLDLIPGQQGFGPWVRNLLADASVFAVVPIMLIIQHILSWDPLVNFVFGIKSIGPTAGGGIGGVNLGLPFMGSPLLDTNFVTRWGIGFVIFAITPKIADIIRDMLKIPPFKYGSAFKEAVGPISALPKLGLSYTGGKLQDVAKRKRASGEWTNMEGAVVQNLGGMVETAGKQLP